MRVRFKQPYAPFLRMAALSPLAPISPTAVKKMGQDFSRRPVDTGPVMVKEWVPKSQVTLVRNAEYRWAPATAAHQGPAHVEEITWRFVPEATTRTVVLQTAEVNIAEDAVGTHQEVDRIRALFSNQASVRSPLSVGEANKAVAVDPWS